MGTAPPTDADMERAIDRMQETINLLLEVATIALADCRARSH